MSQRGSLLDMNIFLYTSGYNYSYSKEIIIGSSHAIAVDTQNISPQDILAAYYKMPLSEAEKAAVNADNIFDDKYIGNLLDIIGKTYFLQLDIESQMIANVYSVYQERYLSVGIFSYDPCFSERFGMVNELPEGIFSVDIIGNNTAAVSLENYSEDEMNYYFSTGYVSSYLEHLVLEQFTGIDSVSTAKIFSIAKHQNIPFKYICSTNISEIDELSLYPEDIADIRAAVNAGSTVIVPERNIRVNGWTGTGYIVQNEENHEITFKLSSGISGGSTTSTAAVDMVIITVLTFEKLYGALCGLVSLGAAMLCTENVVGAIGAGLSFVAALVLSFKALEAFYQATRLYYLALSGNTDAEELLQETAKLEVLLAAIGWSVEFILEPIGGSLFGGSLGEAVDEVDDDIIATSERLKEFVYDELSEEIVDELSDDPNFLLYDDEVIEEIVKSEDADVVIDTIRDCGDDVVSALNNSQDKFESISLIGCNGEDGLTTIKNYNKIYCNSPDYYKDLMDKYGYNGIYYDRSLSEYDALARDPAHNLGINNKSKTERQAGLELEIQGVLDGPIIRNSNPAGAEFIDANGIKWDVKGWYSQYAPKGYSKQKVLDDLKESIIDNGENVIIDTTKLSPTHINEVRQIVEDNGYENNVVWWIP